MENSFFFWREDLRPLMVCLLLCLSFGLFLFLPFLPCLILVMSGRDNIPAFPKIIEFFFLVFLYKDRLQHAEGMGWLVSLVEKSPVLTSALEGFLPSLALSGFLVLLPLILKGSLHFFQNSSESRILTHPYITSLSCLDHLRSPIEFSVWSNATSCTPSISGIERISCHCYLGALHSCGWRNVIDNRQVSSHSAPHCVNNLLYRFQLIFQNIVQKPLWNYWTFWQSQSLKVL